MKKAIGSLLVLLALTSPSVICAAGGGGFDVTVKKDGKPVAHAKTDTSGRFATGNLGPGTYNVEFRAPTSASFKGQTVAFSITAGKQKPRQATSEGKHVGAGVAVSVEVERQAKLTGVVSVTGAVVAAREQAPAGMEEVRANVKVINGKRYVWVPGSIGSNMGGKWVEEGTDGAALKTSNKKGGDAEVLRHIQEQSGNSGQLPDVPQGKGP